MTSREDNDAQSASSVETGRATEEGEQHDPNAQDSSPMQVVQVQSLQTPPGSHSQSPPVCGLYYCFSAILCLFSMWKNTKTNHCIEGGRLWRLLLDAVLVQSLQNITYHLGSDGQQHFPLEG